MNNLLFLNNEVKKKFQKEEMKKKLQVIPGGKTSVSSQNAHLSGNLIKVDFNKPSGPDVA